MVGVGPCESRVLHVDTTPSRIVLQSGGEAPHPQDTTMNDKPPNGMRRWYKLVSLEYALLSFFRLSPVQGDAHTNMAL